MMAKVFRMNEKEHVASNLSLEATINWYQDLCGGEANVSEVRECDITTEGMWFDANLTPEDREILEETDETFTIVDGKKHVNIGDLIRRDDCDGELYKLTSFADILHYYNYKEDDEPFVICSTEF